MVAQGGRDITPVMQQPGAAEPTTPQTSQEARSMNRRVRRGEVNVLTAFHKMEKLAESALARGALVEKDLNLVQAAQELDKATRGSKKRERYPQGHLFDPEYAATHEQELIERKAREQEARGKRQRAGRAQGKAKAPEPIQADIEGPANSVSEDEDGSCILVV